MEDLNLIDDTEMEGGLNDQIKGYMLEIAKWAKIIAIIMIVVSVLIVLTVILGSTYISSMVGMRGFQGIPGLAGLIIFLVLGVATLIFIPNFYLLKHANATRNALSSGNESMLTEAFENLKSYFKFWGIFLVIWASLYVLSFLINILTSLG